MYMYILQIGQQWRVVTSYTDKYFEEKKLIPTEKPRPLNFNMEQHKMLNSELKLLYTAITRARFKLWIFDDSRDKRAPMFHYFLQRSLVEYSPYRVGEIDTSVTSSVMSFATKSSAKEWMKQGNNFKDRGLWNVAVSCYNKAGMPLLSKDALGHHYVQLASKHKHHYLTAANYFCECLKLQQSAKYLEKIASCLYNAQLYKYAAELFVKLKVSFTYTYH